jgi:hypothetical protein
VPELLGDSNAPPQVLDWIHSQPEWLEVPAVRMDRKDAVFQHIGPGEHAVRLRTLNAGGVWTSSASTSGGTWTLPYKKPGSRCGQSGSDNSAETCPPNDRRHSAGAEAISLSRHLFERNWQ